MPFGSGSRPKGPEIARGYASFVFPLGPVWNSDTYRRYFFEPNLVGTLMLCQVTQLLLEHRHGVLTVRPFRHWERWIRRADFIDQLLGYVCPGAQRDFTFPAIAAWPEPQKHV